MTTNKSMKDNMAHNKDEETFEDRYVKLRNIAIMLKKELAEQRTSFQSIEKENKKLINERDDQKLKCGNVQILQAEIDRVQDLLESKSKELKLRQSEVLETAKHLSETKSKLIDSYEVNDCLSIINKEFENNTIKLEAEAENQVKTNIILKKKISSHENDILKLRKENAILKSDLSTEMNTLKESSSDLLKEDDEKELNVISLHMEENNKTISALKVEIFNEKENVKSLKEQVKLVDEKTSMESTRAESLMVSVSELRKEISQLNDENHHLVEENKSNKTSLESINWELNNEKMKLIDSKKSYSISEETLMKAKQCAELQVADLKELEHKQKEQVSQMQEELNSVKFEFEAYKARAQCVLKQKAKVSEDDYTQFLFEHQQLISQLKDAENALQQLKCELSTCKNETMVLKSEKKKISQLNKAAAEDIRTLKSSFQKEVELLKEKLKLESEENRRIIDTMSMYIEISDKLKVELETLTSIHSTETNTLMEKITLLENSQTEVCVHSEPTKLSAIKEERFDFEEPKLDFSNMVREDGEGSECIEPSQHYHARLYHPPSLEHLINRPLASECYIEDDSASLATEISSSEFNRMESKASSLERRLYHLSNLLSESEADNVKLTQLCDLLKENIRNSFRGEQREKHLENNEYLKNVLIKFLYLKTGNEKKLLVPVLTTILQLSPQESSSLMNLAAGDDFTDNSTGWSSYLHLWSNN